MNRKKLLDQLNKEKQNLGQRIMVLSNSLYFDADLPAKDLVREQLDAMDDYFEALEARITDLRYDILMDESLDPEFKKALDEAEENAKKKKAEPKREPNFIDQMCDELTVRVDELIDLVHCHTHKDDKHKAITRPEDLEGREIINVNPPHCHECCNDGTGCVKLIMAGDQHICVK